MINLTLNKKVIIFGFIFTFFSSFGQSFFLGLFNAPIRNELGITHGQFGSIYASATIFSSLLLIWVGKKIDDYRILNYSLFVVILLFASSLFFSFVNSIFFLALSGVSELLFPIPDANTESDPRLSFNFNGVQNTARPGTALPIVYGEIVTGSVVISASVDTNQVQVETDE